MYCTKKREGQKELSGKVGQEEQGYAMVVTGKARGGCDPEGRSGLLKDKSFLMRSYVSSLSGS